MTFPNVALVRLGIPANAASSLARRAMCVPSLGLEIANSAIVMAVAEGSGKRSRNAGLDMGYGFLTGEVGTMAAQGAIRSVGSRSMS
jgi:hypothetical protein